MNMKKLYRITQISNIPTNILCKIQTIWCSVGGEHLNEKQKSGKTDALASMGVNCIRPEENIGIRGLSEENQSFLETTERSVQFLEPEVDDSAVVDPRPEYGGVDLQEAPRSGTFREEPVSLAGFER